MLDVDAGAAGVGRNGDGGVFAALEGFVACQYRRYRR